jgi:ribosome-associated protein
MTTRKSAASLDDVRGLARVAARAAADKKGEDIVILEVGSVLAITDAFVIVGASNERLVRAIAEDIEAKVKEAGGGGPIRVEGKDDARWVLLDYGDFVVHVFVNETRRYYDLERLWADAPVVEWEDDARKSAVSR